MGSSRIAVWSGPRNVSTALMYSFAQRHDARVLDEPLFGYFLKHTGADRPSRDEVLSTMETDPSKVIEQQLLGPVDRPLLFMKHMANHLEGLDWAFICRFQNVILTRHPADVIASYSRHIQQPTILDLAYEHQIRIVTYLKEAGLDCAILDSATVCNEPERTLKALCNWLRIPFQKAMLSWKPGARPEDGVWAKYWYQRVHQSSGFTPYLSKNPEVPQHMQSLVKASLPLYEELVKHKLA